LAERIFSWLPWHSGGSWQSASTECTLRTLGAIERDDDDDDDDDDDEDGGGDDDVSRRYAPRWEFVA